MTRAPLSLLSRRSVLLSVGGALAVAALPASALTVESARALIDKAIGEVNTSINSGKSEQAMFGDFERIFSRYADVPTIARSALGPAARSTSASDMKAFTRAFQSYISRKYGRRFREFIGGRIEVTGAKPIKTYYEVISVAFLRGESPFDVRWHVSERGGKQLFFNIIIEGVNMLASERAEVGALLDRRRGNVAALTADLNGI